MLPNTTLRHTLLPVSGQRSQRAALTSVLAVDDVERPVWSPSILQHLGQQHGTARHSLRRLQQVGVAAHHAHGEHPQRDHSWEVEGGDACTHPHGQAVSVGVHVLGDGGECLTQHQRGDAAGVLHNLCRGKTQSATHNCNLGFCRRVKLW